MTTAAEWVDQNVPDQSGRTIVITGASAGLGAEATGFLASKGARVILAVRSMAKGQAVANEIQGRFDAHLDVRELDLSSLASVRSFADGINSEFGRVDVLLNNAGVMAPPRSTTKDGFELQLGTNHLGHFAVTGLLQPSLLAAPDEGRVVNVSSIAAASGEMHFDDLMGETTYSRSGNYSQSKLANLLFTFEHQRRALAHKLATTVAAAHPGLSSTDLVTSMRLPGPINMVANKLTGLMAQSPAMGSLPLLAAATQEVGGGSYTGPTGMREMKGLPGPARIPGRAHKDADASRLWDVSQELTGVEWLN